VKAFPSYDLPFAEAALREWLTDLVGLQGDELEEWLGEQAALAIGMADRELDTAVQLSKPEVWNLLLVAQGYTLEGVAEVRCVSRETVKWQMRRMMDRTGLDSRVQLVLYALATGQLLGDEQDMEMAA
jgi:DNA-binding NarL/FixJ family response regulator